MAQIKEKTTAQNYISDIPKELRRAIKALGDDNRLVILVGLIRNGEMSFSQLLMIVKGTSSTLTHHLRTLIEAGIIENHYAKKLGVDEYSFYDVTGFGKSLIRNVFRSLDVTQLPPGNDDVIVREIINDPLKHLKDLELQGEAKVSLVESLNFYKEGIELGLRMSGFYDPASYTRVHALLSRPGELKKIILTSNFDGILSQAIAQNSEKWQSNLSKKEAIDKHAIRYLEESKIPHLDGEATHTVTNKKRSKATAGKVLS